MQGDTSHTESPSERIDTQNGDTIEEHWESTDPQVDTKDSHSTDGKAAASGVFIGRHLLTKVRRPGKHSPEVRRNSSGPCKLSNRKIGCEEVNSTPTVMLIPFEEPTCLKCRLPTYTIAGKG